jgi:hypothetical protein
MQERRFYEDHELQITASEIRCKHLTIRTDSVTSVSIASARPLKWLPLILLLPALPFGFFIFAFSPLMGRAGSPFFVSLLVIYTPLILIFILASFMRVSRIYLQTAGGPVVLALKFQLVGIEATLTRFRAIKDAVEQAMEAARRL